MPKPIAEWNPQTQLWETGQVDLLSEQPAPFSETWPTSGMTRSGQLFPLPVSEPPHQRERVFMLAHPADAEGYGRQRLNDGASGKAARSRRQWLVSGGAGKPSSSDAASDGWDQGRAESEGDRRAT